MASVEPNIMECPLVIWVDTFRKKGSPKLKYSDLCDGVFLIDVMKQIENWDRDPRSAVNVVRNVADVNGRLENWDFLMRTIQGYYTDVLQQLLIQKLPNINIICHEAQRDSGIRELKKTLLLILGCAVQCERKEEFIKVIMDLEISVQQEIVESIKQITHDSKIVLPTDCQDPDVLFGHLVNLIKERDGFSETMNELARERDFYLSQVEGTTVEVSPASTPEKQQVVVELTECKARIRKLKEELDEKQSQLNEVRGECDDCQQQLIKLRSEKMELLKDACSARSLRDEVDILREKVGKVNNYEAEILKYKEKLNEMDFFKSRVEELRDDNRILVETKCMLEQQLTRSHTRIETVVEMEQQLIKYRQQIEDMTAERDADSERISNLIEENAKLQLDRKMNLNETTNLAQEIEMCKAKVAGGGGAISDQLKETTNAKLLRLELENQHLQRKLDDMKEVALIENTTLHLQQEKENKRLLSKLEKLEQDNTAFQQKCFTLEEKNREINKQKEHIEKTLEYTKESSEKQLEELERQNEDLSQTVEVIRTRNQQTTDTKLKDLEKENKRLHEMIGDRNKQITKLEFSSRKLNETKSRTQEVIDKLESEKDSLERGNLDLKLKLQSQQMASETLNKMEKDYLCMEMENEKLKKTVNHLQTTIQKKELVEQENINMKVENQNLKKTNDRLQTAIQTKEQIEQENISMKVENQKLQRMLDHNRTLSTKIVELENENGLLKKEIQQSKRLMEMKKSQDGKLEKMELDLMDLDNENMKLQKQLEITTNRMQQLDRDNGELESECKTLQENLDSTQKRLSKFESVKTELERENVRFQEENAQLAKENKQTKKTLELKESALDKLTKESGSDHKEFVRNLQVEKQAVTTLRTDLMNEKNRTQELHQELEKLRAEVRSVGTTRDQLVSRNGPVTNSRFKALESMVEDGLNKSVSLSNDKMQALETRLEESKSRNQTLMEDLRLTRRECESLKQRYREEAHESRDANQTSHLVRLERDNAKLMEKSDNLKSQNDSLNEQMKKLELQNSKLQTHTNTIQSEKSALQSHNAQLQGKMEDLRAQSDSLQTQYRNLQTTHQQLLNEHDSVQRAHESLISEHGSLKSIHKSLEREKMDMQKQMNNLMHMKYDDSKSRDHLTLEREQLKLRDENDRLLRDNGNLKEAYSAMEKDKRELVFENKNLKTDYNNLIQDNQEYKEKLRNLEGDLKYFANKYDNLDDLHQKALEDKENLMHQLEMLIAKNQELLNYVLDNKEQMHGQEKSYLEQLVDLRRQKERLEEKIMDHYKNREKQKKNKSLGALLLQKVRGLKRSKSRPNLLEGSPDSSSLGSATFTESDNKPDKRRYRRHRGSNAGYRDDTGSPSLAKSNRGLAKSTSALDTSPTAQRHSYALSEYRGSCSTDNLLTDSVLTNYSLLPGMGGPVSDDEGGFGDSKASNSDVMTLEEFLAEGLDRESPKQKPKIELKSEDTESRSSENSEGRPPRRRPAPLPPNQQSRPTRMGSIPDVAAQSDVSVSQLSRVSTGSSGGSSQDVRPDSVFSHVISPTNNMQPKNTSTPAKHESSPQFRIKQNFDDLDSSAFSRVHGSERTDNYNSPQYKQNRDTDTRLTPDARLDILTRGNHNPNSAFSPPNPSSGHPQMSNHSSPNDSRRSHDGDLSIRSGPSQQSPQQQWNRGQQGGQGQSSGPRPMKATHPQYPRSHSPGRVTQQFDEHGTGSPQSTPQRKSNILVSRADINSGPRPYGQPRNMVRARPASAFGAPVSMNNSGQGESQLNSSFQSPLNNARPSRLDLNNSQHSNQHHSDARANLNNSYTSPHGQHPQSNGPMSNGPTQRRRQPNMGNAERPKSVPPSMYNMQHGGSDSDSSYNNDYNHNGQGPQNHMGQNKGTPPVPPPRKTKDIMASGRYSIMPSPMSASGPTGSRMQLNNAAVNNNAGLNNSNAGLNNNQQPAGAQTPMSEEKKREIWAATRL